MKIIIIGGGASGMIAAYAAALNGASVSIIEHNEKLGKKIYITGKGRCNLTNACTVEELISHVFHGSKFLYSAFYNYSSDNIIKLFEENGCPLKIERGNRVFPVSDHASDVTKTLKILLEQLGVKIFFNTNAVKINSENNSVTGITIRKKLPDNKYGKDEFIDCDAIILATGGLSYPSTGSDGSGYKLAKSLGHSVTELNPGLTGLITKGDHHKQLEGLSLKNITLTVMRKSLTVTDDISVNNNNNKKSKKKRSLIFEEQGELLFTAKGISGPLVLKASSHINPGDIVSGVSAHIDLKPALDEDKLDKRILRDFNENPNKKLINALKGLYPSSLTPVIIKAAGLDENTPVNEVTANMRKAIITVTKNWCFDITGLGSFSEAVITRGGIDLKEIDPSTMCSKLINGLYFAGEIMDLDAATGGFNLQIAWSTGYLAGESAAMHL